MCGICGIISTRETSDRVDDSVSAMNLKIYHRGPDEEGRYNDHLCSLAMRRLSIIDLSHGKQPIYSDDKSALVFFNGEIYNFLELRSELRSLGISFKTESDTEVVVNAYQFWGEDFVGKLKGMFAFCIYDFRERKWIFARDRFGEKPLYYYYVPGYLSFSSELGSLLEDRNVPRKLNHRVLPVYLTLSYVPEPDTLIDGVKTLRPGHIMVFQGEDLKVRSYFAPKYSSNENIKSFHDAIDLVTPVWEKSVKRQMISDVPLGAFLSGGIDSSTVVASMQKNSSKPIQTFTVKFEEESYDESQIARQVAKRLGTIHHEIAINNAGFTKDLFWELIDKTGVPFPDSSAIPTYFITKEIRKHVKVALSGDGGDEVFGGYKVFSWYKSIVELKSLPHGLRKIFAAFLSFVEILPPANRISILRQLKKANRLADINTLDLPVQLHALFEKESIKSLLNVDFSLDKAVTYPREYENWSPLRRIMHFRLMHNLPLDMLTKVDRMSMANSLEVRAPFLDADLFDVVSTIPDRFLMAKNKGKLLVREMMKNDLPAEVFNHPKKGFSIPLHKYQNEEFWDLVNDLIVNDRNLQGIFNKEELKIIVERASTVVKDNAFSSVYKSSHQLWSLLQLSGWISYYKVIV